VVVLGGDKVGQDARSGARLQLGYWALDEHLLGIEAGAFFLGQETDRASVLSFGNEMLARPLRDGLNKWAETTRSNIEPPNNSGRIGFVHDSNLWGAELDVRSGLLAATGCNVDLLAGYRTVGLYEGLTITEALVTAGMPATNMNPGSPATSVFVVDRFKVNNQFHGGQIGAEAGVPLGQWSLEGKAQLALGCTVQDLDIFGVSSNGTGGILANASNIGHNQRAVFSVMPEIGLTVGYQVTDWMRTYFGYDLLYWNTVLRPGSQIDRIINRVTQSSPAFNTSDFWAQGINLGLEFHY
jgi:hypothetical protein